MAPRNYAYELGEYASITRGTDGCIWLFSANDWQDFVEKIEKRAASSSEGYAIARYFLSGASQVEFDSMFRFIIPPMLREWAGITSEVVFAGVGDRIEIWAPDRWDAAMSKVTEKLFRDAGF